MYISWFKQIMATCFVLHAIRKEKSFHIVDSFLNVSSKPAPQYLVQTAGISGETRIDRI